MSTENNGISPEEILRETIKTYIDPLIGVYIRDKKWSPDDIMRIVADELGKSFARGIGEALKDYR